MARPFLLALAAPFRAEDLPPADDVEINGLKLHYYIEGKGEPILLIHGQDSNAIISWIDHRTMELLAKSHEVIAICLPGFGLSDRPNDANAYGNSWVEDVGAVLDHLKIQRAHII